MPTARAAIGVSQQQTLAALKALDRAGVIRQLSPGTYDRQFAASEQYLSVTREQAVAAPNGELPAAISATAGVFVTGDTHLGHQQNLRRFDLAIFVVHPRLLVAGQKIRALTPLSR